MRFDNKVALITGAARGIGACVALQFAKEGANIVALDITQDIPAIDYALGNVSDLEKIVDDVLAANPKNIEQYKAGNSKALNALVGQIMKGSQGKANPQQVSDLLRRKLD